MLQCLTALNHEFNRRILSMKKFMTVALATAMTAALACTAFADGEDQKITEVSYNITVTGGNASYTMQFTDWNSYTFQVNEGTADYEVEFPEGVEEEDGFTNLGYVMSAADPANTKLSADDGITVVVNTITVNGYKFDLSANTLKGGLNDDGAEMNGELNIWWGKNGADIASVDGTATIKFSSSALTLQAPAQYASSETGDAAPIIYLAAIVGIAGIAMVASKKRA